MKFMLGICLAVLVVSSARISSGIDYFPSEQGPTFEYEYGPVELGSGPDGLVNRYVCIDCLSGSIERYLIEGNGDVLFLGVWNFSNMPPRPDRYYYSPPLKYLQFPLLDGQVWSTESDRIIVGGDTLTVEMTAEVLGPTTVSVEAGDFEVVAVRMDYQYPQSPWLNRTDEMWFHIQLGPVNGLVSWTGIVNAEDMTWGGVKALFGD